MVTVDGTIEAFAGEKGRRGSLLAQLHFGALLERIEFCNGKAGMQQNIQSYDKPGVKIFAQSGGAQDGFGRTEIRPPLHRSAKAVKLLGELFTRPLLGPFAQHLGGGGGQAMQVVRLKERCAYIAVRARSGVYGLPRLRLQVHC